MAQPKGAIPWNKGLKTGIVPKTAFKKGHQPWSRGLKLGSPCEEIRIKRAEGTKKNLPRTAWKKGQHFSPQTEFKKGHISTCGFKKGNIPWNKNKSHLSGNKHWNWQGGIRGVDYLERRKFRQIMQQLIFERDNYTCQLCGNRKDLQVDHIQSWAEYVELRFSMDNCRTLCAQCHYQITFGRPMPEDIRGWGHNLLKGVDLP